MIRNYQPGDEEGINALYQAVFGKVRSLEEWQWKFNEFSVGEPIIIVAELDGKIVGHAACLKIPGAYQQVKVMMGERVDIMVHPDYQKRGIYKSIVNRMIEECENQNIDVLYGFPAQTAKQVFLKTAGGEDLGNIPRFLAIQRPGTLIGAKLPLLSKAAKIADFPYRLASKRKSAYRLKEITMADFSVIDELYHRYAAAYPLHAVRDSDYIQKRYLEHPTRKYKIYLLSQGEKFVGYTVLHTEKKQNGLTVSTVVDLWAENFAPALSGMFRAVRNADNTAMINCWAVKDSPKFQALKKAGFRHINSPMPFVIKSFNEKLELADVKNWHLSQSDVDSY